MSGAGPLIGVLDYGSGNLHSVCRALDAAGARIRLSSSPDAFAHCRGLVVPGVGAFAACMAQLRAGGGVDLIRSWAAGTRPLLGVCVGHQVLFSSGDEHGTVSAGIGVFDGTVTALTSTRVPHMGWNLVEQAPGSRLFAHLEGRRFYFVHSYGVHTAPADALVSWVEHEGDRCVAAVERGPVCSTQFHPEKSGRAGARLLRNWLDLVEQA
ncbi:imidazole glycerol phosphate synthase subunit HisH [Propionibacterium australiense]|uniref:Imidazole glycerol phosphate synthase subunit HisH n=1 Tax=Propionibacterium australiense TaxID=119981 RepID=A0A383S3S0_9ACTN|nr:imidazole glycerol phosphate synthase subunit HisH [Propionibacterium australiense]SYZ32202.1 Imidazole glycerol phosphate synthase subunit HisH [hisH] [Propionibacterium australiense]VEH90691.1 Imidazole glycerol phosphate synthase subunit HisH [Propionibacterium australiense]